MEKPTLKELTVDPSPDIATAIGKIRDQLEVNLGYFGKTDRETLEILQGHIEDQLREIERIAKKQDVRYHSIRNVPNEALGVEA